MVKLLQKDLPLKHTCTHAHSHIKMSSGTSVFYFCGTSVFTVTGLLRIIIASFPSLIVPFSVIQ